MKELNSPHARQHRRYNKKRRRRIVLALLLLFGAGLAFAASAVFEMDAWSKLDVSAITDTPQSLIVYDAAGAEVTALHASEDRIWVSLNQIPKHTRDAFISAEDARFYDHFGVDIVRIFGAAWADLKAGAYVQGASTISQQLIKLSHLTSEKRMERKLEEAVLAYQLERVCSKEQILEMYLNYVYFGGGYFGVEAAARGYFGVHVEQLSVAQSAQLAGILKAPSRFAPHLRPEASRGRRDVVLDLMTEYGFLSAEECALAKAEEPVIVHTGEAEKRGYYVDLALTEACALLNISMDTLLSGGYRIHTAMDASLQAACEHAFAEENNFPKGVNGEQPEGAIVIVNVETGGIAALLGGRENDVALAYNRATRIRRQPGSVIKPILVYAPALESGYTAATMLLDEQVDFDGYQPSNPSNSFAGWVTMREAVTRSLNVPAVSVMAQLGVIKSKRFAETLGISFDRRDKSLALALGGFTYGVSPMMIAGAYAAFAAGGVYSTPQTVLRITDRTGAEVYRYVPQRTQVMERTNAYVLTSMLQSVVKTGTGKRLGELGMPLAGKTGTTGDELGNRDIWMAAYNPNFAATVWIGFDDASGGKALPETATGGTFPAMILSDVFKRYYTGRTPPDFVMPSGVREYRIDSHTLTQEHVAVLANALTPEGEYYSEVFVVGTEPGMLTSYWQIPSPPTHITATVGERSALIYFETPSPYVIYRLYRENREGKSVLVGEFSGVDGSVATEDDGIQKSGTYRYYVIPAHPQLLIDGQAVTGEASRRVSVTIP